MLVVDMLELVVELRPEVQDGGKTWENKGLKKSEHLSKIIIHPENSNDYLGLLLKGHYGVRGETEAINR